MWFPILAILVGTTSVSAQTQAQVQSCANSVEMTSYPPTETYTYSTTDTSFFDAVYSYDPSLCAGVPVQSMTLRDRVGETTYTCTLSQFGTSGVLTSVCNGPNGAVPVTRRTMAILSKRDGHDDWHFVINIGARRTTYNIDNGFGVEGTGPVPSAGINTRRDWREELRRNFDCPIGQSMCPTGIRRRFECKDISSDVMSCGACPGSKNVVDCTDIEGADEIECRSGSCHVLSCEKGWTVSSNNQQCIPDIVMYSRTI